MKGIVLAGGSGTRLHPVTRAVSKQLLPVYDKPMVYYPISVLMLAGIRDILIITTPHDMPLFQRLLGDGSAFGVRFEYEVQHEPNGLAQAFVIGAKFIDGQPGCLVLGDNIMYGHGLPQILRREVQRVEADGGCSLFGFVVHDPERYGVAEVDSTGKILSIEEKPTQPKSNLAVTGLYFYDAQVSKVAAELKPSLRGEYEITDVNRWYVEQGTAHLTTFGRGMAWLDMGTHESLLEASQFVHTLETRQGEQIACLEEIAFSHDWLSTDALQKAAESYGKSTYGVYLSRLAASVAKK
jgi:glucose-1-phosphate thymidylyltransferase